MKIANKISLLFFVIAVFVAVTLGISFIKIMEEEIKDEVVGHLQSTLRSRQHHIETYLQMLKISIGQLSKSVILEDLLKTEKGDPAWKGRLERAMTRLARTRDANSSIAEFSLLDVSGRVIASSDESSIGIDRSADAIFTGGRKGVYIKDAYYSDVYKEPMISIAAPMLDGQTGSFLGVLTGRVTLKDLYAITTDLAGLGYTGEIYIVNKYGYMITPSRRLGDVFLKQKIDTKYYRQIVRDGDRTETALTPAVYSDYAHRMVIGVGAYNPEMQWSILSEVDLEEAYSPLRKLRYALILTFFLIVAMAGLLGLAIAGFISRPIHALEKGAKIIGKGDLSYKVGTDSRDEIGELSRVFDTMTAELKTKLVTIYDLNKEVAERAKAEKAAERAAREWTTTFDSMAEGVSIHDPNYTVMNVNKALCTIMGKPKQELIGKKCYEIFHGMKSPPKGCPMERSRLTNKDEQAEIFEPSVNRWLLVSNSPVYDNSGKAVNFVHVVADITEQKRMRDQLAQSDTMAALGRFSAGAAHEIKNPLGIILGGIEYLRAKSRDADPESRQTIDMVSDAVLRVDSIVNALTELIGPSQHAVKKVDVNALVDDTLLRLKPKVAGGNVTFSTSFPGESLSIAVDIDQIEYALLSVLANAADATPNGGEVRIVVRKENAAGTPSDPPKCVIDIVDKGEGISAENLSKVFEPFFTTRRDNRQVGLGLTVAKEFIDINKGDIAITSQKGKGTTVRVAFPLA